MLGSLYIVAVTASNWVAGPPLRISSLMPVFWPERGSTRSPTVRSPLMSAVVGSIAAYCSQWSTSGNQSVCTTSGFGQTFDRSLAVPPPPAAAVVAPPALAVVVPAAVDGLDELFELLPQAAATTNSEAS